jgi:hypothetical protein
VGHLEEQVEEAEQQQTGVVIYLERYVANLLVTTRISRKG